MYGKLISIDIGSYALKAVFSKITFKSISIERKILLTRQHDEDVDTLLERFHANYATEGYIPIFLFPSNKIQYRSLVLPFRHEKDIKAVLKSELEAMLPNTEDQMIADFIPIAKQNGQNSEILAASVSKAILGEYIDTAKRHRLVPGFIGLESLALETLAKSFQAAQQDHERLILDIGYSKTLLTITIGASISYIRSLPIGARDFNDIIVSQTQLEADQADEFRKALGNLLWDETPEHIKVKDMGLTRAQIGSIRQQSRQLLGELLKEIQLSIVSRVQKLDKNRENGGSAKIKWLLVTGGFARQGRIKTLIAHSLSMHLAEFPDIQAEKDFIEGDGENSDFYPANGLLFSLAFTSQKNINLLQEDFAKLSVTQKGKTFRAPVILICIAILALMANLFAKAHLKEQQALQLQSLVTERAKQYFPDVPLGGDVVRSIKSYLLVEEKKLGGKKLPGSLDIKILDLIKSITLALKDLSFFNLKDFRYSGETIRIDASTDSYASVNEVETRLKQIDFFSSVEMGNIRKAIRQEEILFSITLNINMKKYNGN